MIKYRGVWMGFAMLWIIFFHTGVTCPLGIVTSIKKIGYGGVDIFLFASGIGNYYSYNKDNEPLEFFKRRISRLAPVYIPFIIIWCIYNVAAKKLSPLYIIGNLLGSQYFSNVGTVINWYICVLLVCYLLTPYIATAIKKGSFSKNILLVVLFLLLSTAFWKDENFCIAATRLPIYVIGMIFAKYDDVKIGKKHIIVGGAMFIAGLASLFLCNIYFYDYIKDYGVCWYLFILITPFLCYLISCVASLTEKNKITNFGNSILKTAGKYSFEIYLVHIFLFNFLKDNWDSFKLPFPLNNYVWAAAIALAFAGALLLNLISKPITKLIKKTSK